MLKKVILFALLAVALVIPSSAQADRGGVPHKKSAPVLPAATFSCDGTTCVYAIPPAGPITPSILAPSTQYDTSIQFVSFLGGGCNTGTGGWRTDDAGGFVQFLDQSEIMCGSIVPGTVTAWVRSFNTSFGDPAIPGTQITVLIG